MTTLTFDFEVLVKMTSHSRKGRRRSKLNPFGCDWANIDEGEGNGWLDSLAWHFFGDMGNVLGSLVCSFLFGFSWVRVREVLDETRRQMFSGKNGWRSMQNSIFRLYLQFSKFKLIEPNKSYGEVSLKMINYFVVGDCRWANDLRRIWFPQL